MWQQLGSPKLQRALVSTVEEALKYVEKDNDRLAAEEQARVAAEAKARQEVNASVREQERLATGVEKWAAEVKKWAAAEVPAREAAEAEACTAEQIKPRLCAEGMGLEGREEKEARLAAEAADRAAVEITAHQATRVKARIAEGIKARPSAKSVMMEHAAFAEAVRDHKAIVSEQLSKCLADMASTYSTIFNMPEMDVALRFRLDPPCISCREEVCIGQVGMGSCIPCARRGHGCSRSKLSTAGSESNTQLLAVLHLPELVTHRLYGGALRTAHLFPVVDELQLLLNAEDAQVTQAGKQVLTKALNMFRTVQALNRPLSLHEEGDDMDVS